jgi:hypothetical protein
VDLGAGERTKAAASSTAGQAAVRARPIAPWPIIRAACRTSFARHRIGIPWIDLQDYGAAS